ncbi:thymocyte selection-associated high mobility group box protein TOX-like isoform X2 [Neocloeon triangulifer]|uniref:thymocyte selection-associated high mobility group box protein TOX-like isoform X2 n=1 Tax=Neocloeon triangulifer TaxID=2078957 RepID=UPI00286FA176|nr:thymocyte selection-associated high mobility group box protein TOX-like isoform X2 [Neocloeon triangulifer]
MNGEDISIASTLGNLDCSPHMTDPPFHTPSFGDEGFEIHNMISSAPLVSQGEMTMQNSYQPSQNHQMSMHTMEPNNYNNQIYMSEEPQTSQVYSVPANVAQYNNQMYQPMQNQQQQQQQQQMLSPMGQQTLLMAQQQQSPQQQYAAAPQQHPQQQGQPPPQQGELCTSEDSDDSIPNANNMYATTAPKRPSPEPIDSIGKNAKKPKVPKKKKKRDPNEPQKPVSAYALFFRDTQAAIKGQNPNASFGEVSKIVASMWDALDVEHKNVYKKKTELAKKEYLKALAAYRATLVSKEGNSEGMVQPPHAAPMQQQQPPQQMQQQQQMYYSPQQPQYAQQYPGHQYQQQQQMQHDMMGQAPLTPTMAPDMFHHPQQQQQYAHQEHLHIHEQQRHHLEQSQMPPDNQGWNTQPAQICIRAGCHNRAISNAEWQDEYCSNECVVSHCRDVFSSWVSSNQQNQQNFSTVK